MTLLSDVEIVTCSKPLLFKPKAPVVAAWDFIAGEKLLTLPPPKITSGSRF